MENTTLHQDKGCLSEATKLTNASLIDSSAHHDIERNSTGRDASTSEHTKKSIIGCVIVIFLALSWVGAQQFAQAAVRLHKFDAPYFMTWFSTCWMLLCFPGYLLFVALVERNFDRFLNHLKQAKNIFGLHPVTVVEFFKIILTLNIIWLAVNYLYIYGLKFIAASDASAIMVSNVAFVYLLSLCVLGEKLYVIRVAATALCIGGVVLFGYAEGFKGSDNMIIGVAMIIASAFGAAVYKVTFKKVINEGTLGQVSFFLTLLGVANVTIMWSVNIILHVTDVEGFSCEDIPWRSVILSSILGLVFNFLVNFGIAYTYPLFISIAMMVGIPINVTVDVLFHGEVFTVLRIIATLLVFAGFALTLFPDTWNDPIHTAIRCKTAETHSSRNAEEEDFIANDMTNNDPEYQSI